MYFIETNVSIQAILGDLSCTQQSSYQLIFHSVYDVLSIFY